MDAPGHKSRRASAAAAADASSIQPINARASRTTATKRGAADKKEGAKPSRITKPPRLAAPPPPRDPNGQLAVLQARGTVDADEVYGEQEKALSEFLRLHPMLSARFPHTHARAHLEPDGRVHSKLFCARSSSPPRTAPSSS